ncbi:putative Zn2/Cys6 DNA-binding protein [Seiridium cardinale]
MFGTLKYNNVTKDHEHIALSRPDGVEARGYTAQAAKCTGELDGCQRCQATLSICTYKETSVHHGRKRRQRSQEFDIPECSEPIKDHLQVPLLGDSKSLSSMNAQSSPELGAFESGGVPSDLVPSPRVSQGSSPTLHWHHNSWQDPAWEWLWEPSSELPHVDVVDMLESSMIGGSGPTEEGSLSSELTSLQLPAVSASCEASPSATCQCLKIMVQLLEDLGPQETEAGVDRSLKCLGRGIAILANILDCTDCDACTNQGMLLLTVLRQLGVTVGVMVSTISPTNGHQVKLGPSIEWQVSFGCYAVEDLDLKLWLVLALSLRHIYDLEKLLKRIKINMRLKPTFVGSVVDVEDHVRKACNEIQALQTQVRAP